MYSGPLCVHKNNPRRKHSPRTVKESVSKQKVWPKSHEQILVNSSHKMFYFTLVTRQEAELIFYLALALDKGDSFCGKPEKG